MFESPGEREKERNQSEEVQEKEGTMIWCLLGSVSWEDNQRGDERGREPVNRI
jgi:hypothetical protein